MKTRYESDSPPNIIFIVIDDLGWRDLACLGSEFYETPNLDRLAAQGITFTDAYAASPVCSPTRASLLTGKYPATVGITNYIDYQALGYPGDPIQTRGRFDKLMLTAGRDMFIRLAISA